MLLSRYSRSFVRGLLFGCTLVFMWLIISTYISRRISYAKPVHSKSKSKHNIVLAVNDGQGLKNSQRKFGTIDTDNISDTDLLKDDFIEIPYKPRKSLLVVIVTSLNHLERTINAIERTWGNETADYSIVVGNKDSSIQIPKHSNVLESLTHPDFPAYPYISFEELVSVLDLVRDNFLDRYRWFLIGSSNLYVSMQHMEVLVASMNSNSITCIGHPSNNKEVGGNAQYCDGGPGVLLSHLTIITMKRQANTCHGKDITGDGNGYHGLSRCLSLLMGRGCCHGDNPKLEEFFIYDKKILSRDAGKLWKRNFTNLMTLYPIVDTPHMEAVHAFSQSREITYHHRTSLKLKEDVKSSCEESSNISCSLLDKRFRKTYLTYEQLTGRCTLFRRGYVPEIRRKVENWDTIVGSTLYNSWNMSPESLVHGDLSREMQYITEVAVSLVKRETPEANLDKIKNMYVRYRGTVGREYILDTVFTVKGKITEKRLSFLLAHSKDLILVNDSKPDAGSIRMNFIVPLDGLARTKVAKFQRSYHSVCIRRKENCRIVFVMFTTKSASEAFMKTYMLRFKRRHSQFIYELLIEKDKFDKNKAYDIGMSKLKDEDLVFLASANLNIASHFFGRCRGNTLRGRQIYYPEIFKYYNMKYVYRGRWKPRNYDYLRVHGHWATHGVACLYKSDYTAIGGYNTIGKWDMDPLSQTRRHGDLEIMTAPDPGVSYWFEENRCNSKLPPAQFSTCLSQRSDDLSDRTSLANYMLYLERKCKAKL